MKETEPLTRRADNEIERSLMLFKYLGIPVGLYEVVGTHLQSVRLLGRGVGDRGHVGAESFGKEQAKVSKTTDTDNTDILGSFTSAVGRKRVVKCDTAACRP